MEKGIEVHKKKNALMALADRLQADEGSLKNTLMKTVCANIKKDEEFLSFVMVCNTYKLNPILKEIYAFPGKGGGVIPVVGIDGWISMVNRQSNYDGVELIENELSDGKLKSVTAKFYIKEKSHPVVVTEYMDECYDGTKSTWKKWGRRMLRHKAYIQGARIAFGFSGIYDEDEAERINAGTTAQENIDKDAPMPTEKETAPIEEVVEAEVVEEVEGVEEVTFGKDLTVAEKAYLLISEISESINSTEEEIVKKCSVFLNREKKEIFASSIEKLASRSSDKWLLTTYGKIKAMHEELGLAK